MTGSFFLFLGSSISCGTWQMFLLLKYSKGSNQTGLVEKYRISDQLVGPYSSPLKLGRKKQTLIAKDRHYIYLKFYTTGILRLKILQRKVIILSRNELNHQISTVFEKCRISMSTPSDIEEADDTD